MAIPMRKGIPVQCWKCWWREGSRCYNEDLGPVPTKQCGEGSRSYTERRGREIDPDHFALCESAGGFRSKRRVLEKVIPSDMLIITSEGGGR